MTNFVPLYTELMMDKDPESLIREPIGRIMAHIGRLFMADLHRNLSHLDIERSYYPLLLIEAGNGNLTQQELASKLSCDKVQVVRIIDYLSSNGYVERGLNPADRRKSSLQITTKAMRILPDIKNAMKETTELALINVPENKIDEIYSLIKMIEKNLTTIK